MWYFKQSYLYVFFALFLTISCAEKEVVIPPLEVPITGKKIIVEDLTGVRCPNCPSANARLEAIQSIYGDNLIIIGVHGDLLTRPLPESIQDFRNPSSKALEASYAPLIGKPSAVINRKIHPEFSQITNPLQDQWQPIIERELQLEQQFVIEADILESPDDYEIKVGVVPLMNFPGDLFIHVMIIENGIVDAQEDINRVVVDYVHDHVLREIITPFEGMFLETNLVQQQVINTSYIIPKNLIPDEWNLGELQVVLFVSNTDGEVIEANIYSLIE